MRVLWFSRRERFHQHHLSILRVSNASLTVQRIVSRWLWQMCDRCPFFITGVHLTKNFCKSLIWRVLSRWLDVHFVIIFMKLSTVYFLALFYLRYYSIIILTLRWLTYRSFNRYKFNFFFMIFYKIQRKIIFFNMKYLLRLYFRFYYKNFEH